MIVLGIDPGTATTGYGLLLENERGEIEVIEYGVILTDPSMPMPERLVVLNQKLKDIILLHRPTCGAVEKLFFEKNVKTALAVGQSRGVVLYTMAKASLPLSEHTPLEVKQAVAGYGKAAKLQIQEMVRAILGLDTIPQPDDAADALAIAICHIHSNKMRSLLQKH